MNFTFYMIELEDNLIAIRPRHQQLHILELAPCIRVLCNILHTIWRLLQNCYLQNVTCVIDPLFVWIDILTVVCIGDMWQIFHAYSKLEQVQQCIQNI